ncbi:MAG: CBS domain-containing protein, partial [Paludibacteraceae bacterium]
DNLEGNKAAQLLQEMESTASDEVRELLEYPDDTIGSMMNTNVLVFKDNQTVEEVRSYVHDKKPEMESLYSIFITDNENILTGTLTLRDLLIADNNMTVKDIMNQNILTVNDFDDMDSLSEIVSKYNLLAVPVVNKEKQLEGMVVIDDIIDDLLDKRRTA